MATCAYPICCIRLNVYENTLPQEGIMATCAHLICCVRLLNVYENTLPQEAS
ncbi:hypothetical protein M404DRAFT_999784 [Pisolithus tinctorius Marx 270]|uniref:Uncharacterized protein n=1 Tax=Pisolithus tinctorius Marx 270 TaxID=870435 RepID=A0A0C3K7V5_PISTI|nr:hypothetical protein M404DRAFT_999784 [Pisolithus tinctorius Marx 270]